MRIRTITRSLAVGAVVIGLAGVGAASAAATGHPQHGKPPAYTKWFNQEISKEINKEINKVWNKTEIENTFNNRMENNGDTSWNPVAVVAFGPQQSYDREAVVIER